MHPLAALSPRRLLPFVLLLSCALPTAAQQADGAQLQRDIESALLALGDRDALGSSDVPLTVASPAQVRYELGAVVVPRTDGAPAVMAVTPGGAAERLRLQPGDRLVAINGRRLAGAADPVATLQAAVAAAGGTLRVEALRDGKPVSATGSADIVAIPAYQVIVGAPPAGRCDGFASDSIGAPPRSHAVYRADITRIDGRSTPMTPVNRHRLAPGRHVLTVRERIDRAWISRAQDVLIQRMQRRERAHAYKPLVLDVRPGTTYRVGARLLRDRLDPDAIRANAYWEPVVWAEEAADCR